MYLSNTTWSQMELINKLLENACDGHRTKATIKKSYQDRTTFGTTNVVVHYGYKFGTDISYQPLYHIWHHYQDKTKVKIP